MFGTIYTQVGLAVLVATFAFALWKGDLPERIGGGLNLAAGLFAIVADYLFAKDMLPIAQLVVDAGLAMGFLFLALRFASLWLGVAMMLQAVQFSLHAYYMVAELPHDWNYARINNLDTTGIIVAIIVGTAMSWRRRVRANRAEEAAKAAAAPGIDAA